MGFVTERIHHTNVDEHIYLTDIVLLIQEAGDEEKKEVSQNLRILRKKYDNIHKFTQEKQTDLELIKVSNETISKKWTS